MASGFRLAITLSVIAFTRQLDTTVAKNNSTAGGGEVLEYCEGETFSARCQAYDEVVLMTSAHYGRMRLGRCLAVNYGNLGCQLDVKAQFNAWCSGRRTCDIRVSSIIDSLPDDSFPCTRDFRGYLEASYICIKVVSKTKEECRQTGSMMVPVKSGHDQYLASVITEETNCGSLDTPWTLRAPPGQTINIHLLNFPTAAGPTPATQHEVQRVCQVYAVIKEKWSTRPGETICASSRHHELVYSSLSNLVEIRVVAARSNDYFMMKIEVTGCADLTASGQSGAAHWMVRNSDTALFGCNTTADTWRMTCDGNRWIGVRKNCTAIPRLEHLHDSSVSVWDVFTASQWAALAVILGIAVVIGMIIFLFGLIYIRRRRSQQLEHTQYGVDGSVACASPLCGLHDYHVAHYADHAGDMTALPAPVPGSSKSAAVGPGSAATSPGGDPGYASCPTTENDYFQTWQLQRHAANCSTPFRRPQLYLGQRSVPVVGMLPLGVEATSQPASSRPYVEHIYESPKFERREFIPPATTSAPHSGPVHGARECICCGPPPQAASAAAGINRCVQYLDSEQNGSPAAARL